ncbi:MAG: hypothetical protein PVJ67_01405 [Candidatus Pacearchaeota archaeon]|jgi:hypothetical protein
MENKKGQVTIFIIVGIIIVVLGILIYMFYPDIKTNFETEAKTPSAFIRNCIEDEVEDSIAELSIHGGYIKPKFYFLKNDEKIGYLCYTNEYYLTCVMQEPLLKRHIETEIKKYIEETADECFDSLVESYERKRYSVNLKRAEMGVEITPGEVSVIFNNTLTLERESTENYESFKISFDKNLYELLSIANSILSWEAEYGDSETTLYMNYYHDVKVEKQKQTDGTTIYVLTDRNTDEKFQFASRSVAWPPGYRTDVVIL